MEHCRAVRHGYNQAVRTVCSKQSGIKAQAISGGAQFALDMSTSFDRVPGDYLNDALSWAGATDQMIQGIPGLHEHCQYVIRHGPCTGRLAMRRGVKRGCTLVFCWPLCWGLFTSVYVAHHIGLATDYAWMMISLTLYADDTHACWIVNNRSDLQFMRRRVLKIYEVDSKFGMKLNP